MSTFSHEETAQRASLKKSGREFFIKMTSRGLYVPPLLAFVIWYGFYASHTRGVTGSDDREYVSIARNSVEGKGIVRNFVIRDEEDEKILHFVLDKTIRHMFNCITIQAHLWVGSTGEPIWFSIRSVREGFLTTLWPRSKTPSSLEGTVRETNSPPKQNFESSSM
jgi:hypothetical protein